MRMLQNLLQKGLQLVTRLNPRSRAGTTSLACFASDAKTMVATDGNLPSLTFWDRNPPYAAVAAAKLAGTALDVKPDLKATKDYVATLTFPTG